MSLWWLLLPLGVALGTSVLNRATWPRGRPGARLPGPVSVLVPARDEERALPACLDALGRSRHPIHERLVYDDRSTDGTPALLAARPEVRVLSGVPLPPGWIGKPHACHHLGQAASGAFLLFLDADVTLTPEGLERLASLFEDFEADLVTAVPRQRTGTFAEALVLPLLHLTYTSWLPLALIHRSPDPRFLAANGQVLALTRRAWEVLGGFEGVRGEVVDDMALARRAKERGLRVVFADGHHLASCRMYGSAAEVREGFAKNLYEGLGERPGALLGVLGLYLGAFVLPYGLLGAGLFGWQAALLPGAVGVGGNLALRGLLALRHGHRPLSVVLHPVAVLLLAGIALDSSRRRDRAWKGRRYPLRRERVRGP